MKSVIEKEKTKFSVNKIKNLNLKKLDTKKDIDNL